MTRRQWQVAQERPLQPEQPDDPDEEDAALPVPPIPNADTCCSTFRPPQSGQLILTLDDRTIFSKRVPQARQRYS